MALPKRVIQAQSCCSRRHGSGHYFRRLNQTEPSKHRVAVGQPRISQRVRSVDLDRPTEVLDTLLVSVARSSVPIEAALQIKSMSLGVVCVTAGDQAFLLAGQSKHQRICDLLRNYVLNAEDVPEALIELPRPQRSSILDAHKLSCYSNPIAHCLNAAVKHVAYLELPAGLRGILVETAVLTH